MTVWSGGGLLKRAGRIVSRDFALVGVGEWLQKWQKFPEAHRYYFYYLAPTTKKIRSVEAVDEQ